MTPEKPEEVDVVPVPGQESEAERRRVRQSNDRDQRAERRGDDAPHNRGYDEAADGTDRMPVSPIDED
jgi:hypothetical protein